MMRIIHIALYVRDLERMKAFYLKYFDVTVNEKYHNPKTGLQTYFITFNDGAKLELMSRPDMTTQDKAKTDDLYRSGYAHICIGMAGKEQVDELTGRLSADGYRVISGPRNTGDGYYESCILDPENNQIEISC